MRKAKCQLNKRRLMFIAIILLIGLFLFFLRAIEKSIEPKIRDICEYYCKSEINKAVSEGVYSVMDENNINYNDIAVKLINNDKIAAVDIRTENINKIKSEITKAVNNNLHNKMENKISIPLGNISDLFFLSGRGPEIEIQFLPEASVNARIISDFSSCGINQTKHSISIEISTEVIAVLPSENIIMNTSTNCILAESIYIGDVPQGLISEVYGDN